MKRRKVDTVTTDDTHAIFFVKPKALTAARRRKMARALEELLVGTADGIEALIWLRGPEAQHG